MKPICLVKIGGALVDSADSVQILVREIQRMSVDWQLVVVHGGGPQATRMAKRYGHVPEMIEGRRVTSALDLEIIQATVCGIVNVQLVAALIAGGVNAVGIAGSSAKTVVVTKRPPWLMDGNVVDFGHVGDIERVDPTLIETLLSCAYVPVVSTIGMDDSGGLYNVNADTTASALAVALSVERFCIVTDSGGLRRDGQLLDECDDVLCQRGKADRWVKAGMVVKLKAGFEALANGVDRVELVGCDGLSAGIGTKLVRSRETAGIS